MSRINRVLVLCGVLLLMSGSAMAQFGYEEFPVPVRLDALSGGSFFSYYYWNDSEEVYQFPGSLTNYADMFTWSFEPGSDAHSFTLNKNEESFGNYFVGLQEGQFSAFAEWNNTTLGYGYPLESMNLGIMFNRQSIGMTIAGDSFSQTWHYFALGADYDFNEDTNIDATFMYRSGKSDGWEDTDPEYLDGSGMGFIARAFYQWRDDVTVVPVLGYMTEEYVKDITSTQMAFGVGFNYAVNEDNDVVFALNYMSAKDEDATVDPTIEDKYTTMPGLYLGAEHEFTDWLTVRGGATKYWNKWDDGDDNDAMDYPFAFSLGAGVAMGDWTIDLCLNQTWLYDVAYWFHGNASTQAPIAMIQAKLFF